MNHGLSHTLALIGLGLATFAVTPAHAQTTAPGPYYATPSWDQKLPAATRFIVLSNWNSEAVLDRETGLVWERSPSTTEVNWNDAQLSCNRRVVGGRMGWRLPSVQELTSLIDPTVPIPGPTLPAGHPFLSVQTFFYWSATSRALVAAPAWVVNFSSALVDGLPQDFPFYVWCVRGGQGPDAQ